MECSCATARQQASEEGRSDSALQWSRCMDHNHEEKAPELLIAAGFTAIEVGRVEGDPLNAYSACRP